MNDRLRPRAVQVSPLLPCLLGAAVGGILFLCLYGVRPLDVTYDAWIFNGYVETDVTQRYAGWLAYRQAGAFFPLTFSELISFPFGGYTSLCDSIPLFEIFFKLIGGILPATFQFEGILCLFNLMMQGACGALLVSLFAESRAAAVLGGGIFCFSPVLLERLFRHTSLSFQWILLLALWLYFTCRRTGRLGAYIAFAALGAGSVWLHVYFTPMVLGFFAAAVGDGFVRAAPKRGGLRRFAPLGLWMLSAAGAVGSAALLGDLTLGTGNTSGYGTMGLNLNALFNPKSLGPNWWVPGQGTIAWSLILPMRAYAENGLESFNYLGLGVLAALAVAALWLAVRFCRAPRAGLRKIGARLRAYPSLTAFLAFSTVFAVSNVVCAFSHVLVRLPLPAGIESVCSAFRASGRLFWSVNETLVLAGIVFWLRQASALAARRKANAPQAKENTPQEFCVPDAAAQAAQKANKSRTHFSAQGTAHNRWAVLALAVLLAVQALDLAPALAVKHADFAQTQTWAGQADAAALRAAMGGKTVLYNLELRDDRPTCAYLLQYGVASNFWLISRDAYGVPELTQDMAATQAALLAAQNPYPAAAYCTAEADTAAALADAGCTVTPCGGVWVVFAK
ncbi:MAG: DUF6311 domain-containing protein [Faecalibacterium sp.]|jgi:hypothetical protein|nr:DUF6311 domain-containing protein [Faecalibacterium sp.]